MRLIALECHAGSPSRTVRRVQAQVGRAGDLLSFHYRIEGRIEKLRLPARGMQPLWQHTCCEAFVARPGSPAYQEFNFSPSGDWAAYAFTAYRQGAPSELPDPGIVLRTSDESLELQASVSVAPGPLRLGLSAVVEEHDGTRSYWALCHAPGKPDFHHDDARALALP